MTQPPPSPAKEHTSWKLQLARVGMLLFVVAVSVFVYSIRDQADLLQAYGYPGIFLLSILASATIVLPAPGLAFVYGAGTLLNPVGVGIAAGLGATLGELSGYVAGFSGQTIVENRALYDKLKGWMQRYGAVTIAVLGFLPLPIFDLAGVAAGALKMPVARFLLFCAAGKIPKMLLVAFAGAYSVDWITQFFQ
ncbi:MAG: VTT domain-containing protein [Anaerolineales bacterium]